MTELVKWRDREIFNVSRYAFCPSAEVWQKIRSRALREDHVELRDYPATSGMTVDWHDRAGVPRSIVMLADWLDRDPVALVSIIARESWHVTCRIFESMSEDRPGEETQAYVLDSVVRGIYEDWRALRSPAGRRRSRREEKSDVGS